MVTGMTEKNIAKLLQKKMAFFIKCSYNGKENRKKRGEKMKIKIWLCMITVLSSVMVLSACGSTEESTPQQTTQTTNTQTPDAQTSATV